MVVISRLFAIFTVFLFNGGCLAGEVANPMSISIHARDVIVKTGDAVTLEAVITNVSATKISLVTLRHDAGGSRSGTDFDMKVIGPGGELRPLHHFSRGSFGFVNYIVRRI